MIWFSAESAAMSISFSPCGPNAIPASRKIAMSGIRIFCAMNPAIVPIARISPQLDSVCLAISIEAGVSTASMNPGSAGACGSSTKFLQPGTYLADSDIGLLKKLAHGEETMELAGEVAICHGDAGVLQTLRILGALIAQGIGARGEHIGRGQVRKAFRACGRGAPVVAVGEAVQIVIAKPADHAVGEQHRGLGLTVRGMAHGKIGRGVDQELSGNRRST